MRYDEYLRRGYRRESKTPGEKAFSTRDTARLRIILNSA